MRFIPWEAMPAQGGLGVAGRPFFPGHIPVPQAVIGRQGAGRGVFHYHDVAAFGVIHKPLRGFFGDIDATM